MHQPVRGQRLAARDLELATGEIGNLASSLFNNQYARRRVPRIQIKFPETVIPSGRNIAKIERR